MFFCIIFRGKICEKIIPKVEKRSTQLENMCYNIVGKKQVGELCSEVKLESRTFSLLFALTAWGKDRILTVRGKIYC